MGWLFYYVATSRGHFDRELEKGSELGHRNGRLLLLTLNVGQMRGSFFTKRVSSLPIVCRFGILQGRFN